jgi:aromatic ring hydroxylase
MVTCSGIISTQFLSMVGSKASLFDVRHENKLMAKGNLVTTDTTHVVGGNMMRFFTVHNTTCTTG